jgi:DNA-binding CsgD family transcriptional regulator
VAAAAAAGIMAGLDHVDRAAILLDDMGLVFKMNAAAERLMGHGVTISNRKLRASTRDGDRLLQRPIAIAAANKPPHESPPLDAVAIPRRNGRPLVVQGAPLVNSARDLFQQARAILIIRDLDHRMEPDDFLLRELFALTPAEIRLAKAIAGGRKLSEVARLLGVSSETARAHLKSVFAKSGAHSQSELSVLLDRMAGPQDDR